MAAISGFWMPPRSTRPMAGDGPLLGEGLQVHPRAEALPGARQHARGQAFVAVEVLQSLLQQLGQLVVQGVAVVGPVEGDQQDTVAPFGEDFVSHTRPPLYLGGIRMPPSTRITSPFM